MGIGYSWQDKYFGRVGYRGGLKHLSLTFGFGLKHKDYTIDYGAAYMGALGVTHYLSFSIKI